MRRRFGWRGLLAGCAIATALLLPLSPARAQVVVTPTQGDSDTFVDALADPQNPWVGQQVVYTFRFYEALDAARLPNILAGAPDYKAPTFSNFWVEGDIDQMSFQVEANGRPYDVSELHTNLFPTVAGELAIDPAQLVLNSVGPVTERTLATRPVILNVRPLPDGAPASFTGSVGDFRLSAAVDTNTARVDEPILLRLTLSGRGNIGMATPPQLPEMPGWRVIPSGTNIQIDNIEGRIGGTRTWDYQLIPTTPGSAGLPPIEFTYFDPVSETYVGTLTEPIPLDVEGLAPSPTPQAAAQAAPASAAQAAAASAAQAADAALVPPTSAPADALPVAVPVTLTPDPAAGAAAAAPVIAQTVISAPAIGASQPVTIEVEPTPEVAVLPMSGEAPSTPLELATRGLSTITLAEQPWFWALWALPLLAIVFTVSATVRERQPARRAEKRQQARAGQEAMRALSSDAARPADLAGQCAETQRILDDYLGHKLGRPVKGMTRTGLASLLASRGVPPELVAEVVDCYKTSEMARFNPAGVDASEVASLQSRTQNTIRRLEKVL